MQQLQQLVPPLQLEQGPEPLRLRWQLALPLQVRRQLPKLRRLDLEKTKFSDASLLAGMLNLDNLNLASTKVSDIASLAALPNCAC